MERNRWNLRQIESVFAQNQVVASNKTKPNDDEQVRKCFSLKASGILDSVPKSEVQLMMRRLILARSFASVSQHRRLPKHMLL